MTARQRRPRTAAQAREAAVEAKLIAEPLLPDNEADPSHEATHQGCYEMLRISAHLNEVPPGACIARHNNRSLCLVG